MRTFLREKLDYFTRINFITSIICPRNQTFVGKHVMLFTRLRVKPN